MGSGKGKEVSAGQREKGAGRHCTPSDKRSEGEHAGLQGRCFARLRPIKKNVMDSIIAKAKAWRGKALRVKKLIGDY